MYFTTFSYNLNFSALGPAEGDDHFLMLWFHKDSLVTVGFRTLRRGGGSPGVLNKIMDFGGPK